MQEARRLGYGTGDATLLPALRDVSRCLVHVLTHRRQSEAQTPWETVPEYERGWQSVLANALAHWLQTDPSSMAAAPQVGSPQGPGFGKLPVVVKMQSSRRDLIQAFAVGSAFLASRRCLMASPRAVVGETRVVSKRANFYHGWPTLARRSNGELLLVCSGGREAHVCPFGWVELMRSSDGGRSWTWPQVLMDSAIDDRDAGVCETAQGSLLVTTFTSLAYAEYLSAAEPGKSGRFVDWSEERISAWRSAHGAPACRRQGSNAGHLDAPLDGRRGDVVRPVPGSAQQPARSRRTVRMGGSCTRESASGARSGELASPNRTTTAGHGGG